MNLIKSFNFEFLKENIKKSTGLVILLSLVVPVFTLLVIILGINNTENIVVTNKTPLLIINFIGMYIIPVLISFVLFGYVYKKSSVDFINSKPINRKSIFITNTIGGILLITAIQLITAIILIVCNFVLPKVIIFPELVIDIFVMMWVSYVFVFLATNIAMSLSGTFLTQIVLTMLILFLIPFCMDGFNKFSRYDNSKLSSTLSSSLENDVNNKLYADSDYTMPYQVFHTALFYNYYSEFDWYSTTNILKMVVLGIIYFIVGMKLFQKRKMENNEQSFFNEKIHILVKALTMLPVFILLNIIKAEMEVNIFIVALIITYYFVYDFIVKRKIKFRKSLGYLVITLIILQITCVAGEKIRDSIPEKIITSSDIAEVKFNSYNYGLYNDNNEYLDYIENKEIISFLIDAVSKYDNLKNGVSMYGKSNDSDGTILDEDGKSIDEGCFLTTTFKLKSGKILYANLIISKEDMKKINELIKQDENYKKLLKDKLITNNKELIIAETYILKDEEKNQVINEIEQTVNNYSFDELSNVSSTDGACINKYYYKNHKLNVISIKDSNSPKILEIVSKYTNKECNSIISNRDKNWYPNFSVIPKSTGERIYINNFDNEFIEFIKKDKDEKFDTSKPYYVITSNTMGKGIYYYTNNIEEIDKLIEVEMEEQNYWENNPDVKIKQ